MGNQVSETRREESSIRTILENFDFEDEQLKKLYMEFRAELEEGAIIHDFIPILAEKSVRNYLRHKTESLTTPANINP